MRAGESNYPTHSEYYQCRYAAGLGWMMIYAVICPVFRALAVGGDRLALLNFSCIKLYGPLSFTLTGAFDVHLTLVDQEYRHNNYGKSQGCHAGFEP